MAWVTVNKAAKILKCSIKTVRRKVKAGELKVQYKDNPKGQPILMVYIEPETESKVQEIVPQSDIEICEVKDINTQEVEVDENWIPIDDVVELSGISRRTIYRQINNNELLATVVTTEESKERTLVKVTGFSQEVQLKWKEIMASPTNSIEVSQEEKQAFELLPMEIKEKAWARYTIVQRLRSYREKAKENGIALMTAYEEFVSSLEHYEICEQEMRKLGSAVSIKTILRWDKTLSDHQDPAFPLCLCDKRRGAAGRKKAATKTLRNQIKKMAWDFRNLRATDIYRMIERDHLAIGIEMPISLRSLSSIVQRARQDELAMAVNRGKKAYKDQIRPHVHRINNALPGDIYESDGHKLNNLVMSPFYAHQPSFRFLIRPILVVWYDVATGCIVGYCLSIAETPSAIRTSLRMALTEYGIPHQLRMDNGTSYKNVMHCPHEFAGRKGNTPAKAQAIEMIQNGDLGLYKNLGMNYSFTIPGNSESKMIEPFWGFCLAQFEKAFPVWIGNKIQERHEELRMTNKALIKKYYDDIPTWEEYSQMLDQYVTFWNNSKRPVLRNALGEQLSPHEAFTGSGLERLSEIDADRLMRDPYPQLATVSRGEILVNGIFYSHPMFMALNGRKVKYYYNERNISRLTVASEHGEILYDDAQMVLPGLQVNDDMAALVDAKHREKQGKLAYLAMQELDSIASKQKALEEMSGDTLIKQSSQQELRKDNKIKKLEGRKQIEVESDRKDFWSLTDSENEALIEQTKKDMQKEEAAIAAAKEQEAIEWAAQVAAIREEEAKEEAAIAAAKEQEAMELEAQIAAIREEEAKEEAESEYTDEEIQEAFRKLGII